MGCVISSVLKLVLQIVNSVLGIAFLLLALLGILLKTSQSFVQSLVDKIFSYTDQTVETKYLTEFILDNAGAISSVLIVGGLVLAGICFVGCISSCCACGILLKVYALIMLILVVAEIIAVAVIFSDPVKYTKYLIDGLKDLTRLYGENDDKGQLSTGIWNFFMTYNGICCGMDGYKDFKSITGSNFPGPCCNTVATCTEAIAATAKVSGCEKKITTFTETNMKLIMYIFIGAILCQAALLVLAIVAICLD